MSTNISKVGITNKGSISAPKMRDESDAHPVKVVGGANIKKQVPGMNNSIVPLIPDPKR